MMTDQRELQRNLSFLIRQFNGFFNVDKENYIHGFYLESQQKRAAENAHLLKQQQELEKQQKAMVQELQKLLSETRTYQSDTKAHQQGKNALKAKFRAILDSYIQQREALNTLTQGRAVKDLQEHSRSQVDNL